MFAGSPGVRQQCALEAFLPPHCVPPFPPPPLLPRHPSQVLHKDQLHRAYKQACHLFSEDPPEERSQAFEGHEQRGNSVLGTWGSMAQELQPLIPPPSQMGGEATGVGWHEGRRLCSQTMQRKKAHWEETTGHPLETLQGSLYLIAKTQTLPEALGGSAIPPPRDTQDWHPQGHPGPSPICRRRNVTGTAARNAGHTGSWQGDPQDPSRREGRGGAGGEGGRGAAWVGLDPRLQQTGQSCVSPLQVRSRDVLEGCPPSP